MVFRSVAEPESKPVEPKLFETWSRNWSRSRNDIFNKNVLQSVWRMLGRKKNSIEACSLWYYCYSKVIICKIWQELESEPKLWTKVEPEQESEPKINNFGSATLVFGICYIIF